MCCEKVFAKKNWRITFNIDTAFEKNKSDAPIFVVGFGILC